MTFLFFSRPFAPLLETLSVVLAMRIFSPRFGTFRIFWPSQEFISIGRETRSYPAKVRNFLKKGEIFSFFLNFFNIFCLQKREIVYRYVLFQKFEQKYIFP